MPRKALLFSLYKMMLAENIKFTQALTGTCIHALNTFWVHHTCQISAGDGGTSEAAHYSMRFNEGHVELCLPCCLIRSEKIKHTYAFPNIPLYKNDICVPICQDIEIKKHGRTSFIHKSGVLIVLISCHGSHNIYKSVTLR